MKKITIKDIAKESGFSICTVSHALNDTAPVNKQTREKIRKIAEKYNYRPSYMARAIKTRKSKYIALILQSLPPSSKNIDLFNGVEKELYRNDYCLNFFNTGSDPDKQKKIIQVVKDRIIDGVILQDSGFYSRRMETEVIDELKLTGIPLFIIEKKTNEYNIPYANIDNFRGGQMAAKHLLELGHSSIGIVTLSRHFHVFEERINGFKDQLKSDGLAPGLMLELEGLREDFSEVIAKLKDLPGFLKDKGVSALFCPTDLLPPYVYAVLKSNGIDIPKDISVIGFDNDYLSQFLEPSLTTINNDLGILGKTAAENIIAKIENNRFLKNKTIVEPYLVERKSTARCA